MGLVLRRLIEISRPVLWINTIGTTVVAMWLAGFLWTWEIVPILLWVTLPFNLLIYGINDIYDQETDADNDRKGGYGGAKIKPSEVRMISWGVVAVPRVLRGHRSTYRICVDARLHLLVLAILCPAVAFQGSPHLGFGEQRRLRLPSRIRAARPRR